MNLFNKLTSIIFKLSLLFIFECDSFSLDLHKISQAENFYQITVFVSENFTDILNPNISIFGKAPSKIYSFKINNQQLKLHNKSSKGDFKNVFSLHESLVVFYISHVDETTPFIDFLVKQLTGGKRPKCLIVHSAKDDEEISTIGLL